MIHGDNAVIYNRRTGDAVDVSPPPGQRWQDVPNRHLRNRDLAVLRLPTNPPQVTSGAIQAHTSDGQNVWVTVLLTLSITNLRQWAITMAPTRINAWRQKTFRGPIVSVIASCSLRDVQAQRAAVSLLSEAITSQLKRSSAASGLVLSRIDHVAISTSDPRPRIRD